MSQDTLLTLHVDLLECGEDMGSDFKMPTSPNMTSMVDDPSWYGLVSAADGRTDEHIVMRGMMTGVCYRDDILDVYARPYAGAIEPQFVLMDDNARPHRC